MKNVNIDPSIDVIVMCATHNKHIICTKKMTNFSLNFSSFTIFSLIPLSLFLHIILKKKKNFQNKFNMKNTISICDAKGV